MRRKGFTLIELLVVIFIILILTSMTVIMLPTILRDQGLKGSAYLVKNAFAQTRQLASSERLIHFIYFIPDKGVMIFYKDSDEDKNFNPDEDKIVGQPIELSHGIIFISGDDGPPLFQLEKPYVGFRSDGSIIFPDGIPDLPLDNPPTEANTDIVLGHKKDRPGRMFLDIQANGIIRKIYYQPE